MLKGRSAGYLGLLLCVDALLAAVVARLLPFYAPNDEYFVDGVSFAAHHRIYNTFLPIGYSGLLGLGARWDGQRGIVVVSVGLSLLMIASAWFYLSYLKVPVKIALVITGLLSIYPDFLLSLHKAQDTQITEVLIFAFVTLLMRAMDDDHLGAADVGLALTLGYAVLVRSNLLLFVFVAWFLFWRFRVPKGMFRSAVQLLIVVVCYVVVTTAVHGRPFLPRNGPYNLYSGFNELTAHYSNEEDSLFVELPAHGVLPPGGAATFTDWNLRDPSLDAAYRRLAVQFLREHPGEAVELVGVKFWNLMRPDTDVHPARSAGGVIKILEALAVPLWLVAMWALPHPGPRWMKVALTLMMAVYMLPFLLTVSSPRFREPLDVFCWVDLGAIVAAWRGWGVPDGGRAVGAGAVAVTGRPG